MKTKEFEDNLALFERYLDSFSIWESFREKRILITGGKGTIGTALIILFLLADRKFGLGLRLFASTRNPAAVPDHIEPTDPIVWMEHGREEEALSGERVDYIVHAACPTDRNFFRDHPATTYLTILHDTERMLKLAREKSATMLFMSSDAEFGSISNDEPVDGDFYGPLDPLNSRSCYPLGKKSSVYLCHAFAEEFDVDVRMVRLSIVTGLFQRYDDPKVMSYFLRCLCEKKNIVLNTAGETEKQILFSLDAAAACLFVLLFGERGRVYNATNPDICMSIRDFAEHLVERFGEGKLKVEYRLLDEKSAGFASPSQLRMSAEGLIALGWKPLVSLDEIFSIDIERMTRGEN
ncbi:MAG: NAD(P)-dependent oxidoreductase [Spirochaetales bacterium]|nr:NAD(P)-dependent oxidoreductase [Spirochaetales bacterium]